VLTIPGQAGGLVTPSEETIRVRELVVEGEIIGVSAQDARDLWDGAKKVLRSPELEICFLLDPTIVTVPDRVAYGRYQSVAWLPVGVRGGAGFRLSFLLSSPYWMTRQPDVYTVASGAEVALVLGTAPSNIGLRIVGLDATPVIRYRDARGIILGEIQFPLVLPVGEWIDYNQDGYQQARWYSNKGSNVATVVPETPTADGHLFGSVDPNDGDDTTGPTIEAVNCHVHATLRKAWL
jgi:hypothetical protein